ncbi:MAG: type I methionyl aminopeptidase [Clostridia bacterium]|jgi:methionyl aminopeptidase|nr:type I methionyl aminopeptidase [Clostridia bacterium]MBQ1963142.1 type I methionyl aminopeptidase [Clostridia bacterium]MBQ5834185.1 type I methionyl aminopeptidase [Clostridia bacterium]
MIHLKNSTQIALMKDAGRITGEALLVARDMIRPGISTYEIDQAIRSYIEKCGAKPAFLGYQGFPGSACISINDEVIHGIPSRNRILMDGDIVKIDTGATYRGYVGDSARTIPVGQVSDEAKKLIQVTRDSFWAGIDAVRVGNRLGDVGSAIDTVVRKNGFSTVRQYVGHGIGEAMHEAPDVPNYGTPGRGTRLCAGMTLAIEPMVNIGTHEVKVLPDGWTVKTLDGSLSAHYENTIALTSDGVLVLTEVEKGF